MSSITTPPWKPLFQKHISTLNPAIFTLATTTSSPPIPPNPSFSPFSSNPSNTVTPRCRTIVYRGFLTALPPNSHNPLSTLNPPLYTSHALTFTTDSRMAKTGEILRGTSAGDARVGTCGGGYVEAAFWVPAEQNQWRVRGRCFLLAEEDVEDVKKVTEALERTMVKVRDGEGWSWKKEVQMHFGNMAPALRGSFANPPPGMPIGERLDDSKGRSDGSVGRLIKGSKIPNQDVLNEEGLAAIARRNFRVGVIVPEVVERLDLNEDEGHGRRWVYWMEDREDSVNGWIMQETWP